MKVNEKIDLTLEDIVEGLLISGKSECELKVCFNKNLFLVDEIKLKVSISIERIEENGIEASVQDKTS